MKIKDTQGNDTTTTNVSSVSLGFTNELGYQRDKTLATLGNGTVTITDKENLDDINTLNRDTQNLTKSQLVKVVVSSIVSNLKAFGSLINSNEKIEENITKELEKLKEENPLMYLETVKDMSKFNEQLE